MGAGEILLNAIDNDGKGQGFDLHLVQSVSQAVTIPVIASSGAGSPQHFTEVRADHVPIMCAFAVSILQLLGCNTGGSTGGKRNGVLSVMLQPPIARMQ
jgi:imidazole glycerol phosphate synthase subunit HisF